MADMCEVISKRLESNEDLPGKEDSNMIELSISRGARITRNIQYKLYLENIIETENI